MGNIEEHQVNYWAGGENYDPMPIKPKRSLKRKLAIVACFLLILASTPTIIYSLSNLKLEKGREVSVASTPIQKQEPTIHEVTIEEPKTSSGTTEVIEHDSYWKISKRVCGTGKFYLSIQDQNGSKALYAGDTVTVSCVL